MDDVQAVARDYLSGIGAVTGYLLPAADSGQSSDAPAAATSPAGPATDIEG